MADSIVVKYDANTPEPSPPVPEYDENWDPETLRFAFEDSSQMRGVAISSADALDGKTVAVFSVGSAIVGLAPALRGAPLRSLEEGAFWVVAGVAWLYASYQCYHAYRPRGLMVGPNPGTRLNPSWLSLTPGEFHFYAMRDMREAYEANKSLLIEKAGHLDRAMFATAVEVLAVGLALLVF